jgi:hypothetical protein
MLAGAPAYSGATVTEVLARVLDGDAVPLAALRPGLPDAVYALVARCTSADPAQRPQDADAMRIALDGARLVPLGTAVPPPHRTQAVPVNQRGSEATEGPASIQTPTWAMGPAGAAAPVSVGAPTQATGVKVAAPRAGIGAPTQATGADIGAPAPATGADTGALASHGSPASRSAPTSGRPAATGAAPPRVARERSRWPLAILGVAAAAAGAFFLVRSMRGSTSPSPADAAIVAVAVADAAPPVDAATPDAAAVLADAAIALAPHDAAPKPRPRPPQPPRPEPCDPNALQRQAREAIASGQDAAALAAAEKLAGCTSNDRAVANIAALAACRLGIAAKARKYFPDVGPRRRGEIRNACARAGIQL